METIPMPQPALLYLQQQNTTTNQPGTHLLVHDTYP